tara:strand:- start:968 stop:1858 length:891 start_codon:yes stop_codon:yes gene_type:complete
MTNLSKPLKILFIGVFENYFRSTNTSQLLCFKKLGHEIVGYNYREKAAKIGILERDKHLISTVKENKFDLVVYSKCNQLDYKVFEEINNQTTTCLWFMDPLSTYNDEMRTKTKMVDYFCCDKKNVLPIAKQINPNSFYVCEGFDAKNDKPHDIPKVNDVTFIGNIYGNRAQMLQKISSKVNVVSNAYGTKHAVEVSKSRINLNFCTGDGASDRVYKTLAAKGFLMSDDWHGREEVLTNGEDIIIFKDIEDLNEKINFYLANPFYAEKIAESGYNKVKNLTRENWARKIIENYEKIL